MLWLWQSPQHLLGLSLIIATGAERRELAGITYRHYRRDNGFRRLFAGVSLGEIILLPDRPDIETVEAVSNLALFF